MPFHTTYPKQHTQKKLQNADNKLAKMLRVPKIKVIEQGGKTLMALLNKPNPWEGDRFKKEDCQICNNQSEEGVKSWRKCAKEGVIYRLTCMTCKKCGVETEYIGETSKTGYLKGLEHFEGLRKLDKNTPLGAHRLECHNSKEIKVEMNIISKHRRALERQIKENILIDNSKAHIILNNKSKMTNSRRPKIDLENSDITERNLKLKDKLKRR